MHPLVAGSFNISALLCIRIQSLCLLVLSTLALFRVGFSPWNAFTGEHIWLVSRYVVLLTDSRGLGKLRHMSMEP